MEHNSSPKVDPYIYGQLTSEKCAYVIQWKEKFNGNVHLDGVVLVTWW